MPRIFVDVWTRLRGDSVDSVDRDIQARMQKVGRNAADALAREMESANPRIRKAAAGVIDSNSRVAASNKLLADSQRRLNDESKRVSDLEKAISDARRSGSSTARDLAKSESQLVGARRDLANANRQVIRDTDAFERSVRRQHLALKSLDDARRGDRDRHRRRGGFGGGQAGNALGGIFTSIPFVPGGKAGAIIGSGLVATLGSVADAAVTASQSLWLLPAAATAGGAAFVTLKLGLSGFVQALKDSGDAKKFAKDLASLAPNAQQAALEIQKLVTGLDGLKSVTQNALFQGVAQRLATLGAAFMPEIKSMTTGIAGAFNGMFKGATAQLLSPGTHAQLTAMINNIVQAFQRLEPAMAPIVDAFTKIAKVGSDFLPGMATAFANLATRFANFITEAQRSGKLHEWIQKGIDAAHALGHAIGELAHKLYDVFGNKSPDKFNSTLDGIIGTATAVAGSIEGISQVVNNLVQDLQPVADSVGGWPNLIQDVITAWSEWQVVSTISKLLKISDILAVTLPASAETGAAGISAALSRVAVPVWLTTLMALWNMGGDSGPGPNIPGGSPMGPQSPQAQGLHAKQDAGQAYAKDHGGQMPPGYMDWLKGGKMPQGMDKYYVPPPAPGTPFFNPNGGPPLGANGKPFSTDPNFPGVGPQGAAPYNPNMPKSKKPGPLSPGDQPWSDLPVPPVPGKKGKNPSDKVSLPYDQAFSAPPRPGETRAEYDAEGALMQARHRKAEDEATLLAMEKDNTKTAEQIQAQKNKIIQDERDINKAQLDLQDARDAAAKKQLRGLKGLTDGMNDIGPKLDEDFGLSKGLAGLAKNLVEFVASLAAAPMLGQLAAVKAGDPFYTGGYGALGIMAENNHMQGRSGLLGIPFGQPGGPSFNEAFGKSPSLGGLGNAAISSAAAGGSPVAAIVAEGKRRGYTDEQIQWIVADAIGESGLSPTARNGDHIGLFQQDSSYPGRNTLQGQVSGFYDRLDKTSPSMSIGDRISKSPADGGVEGGGYGPGWIAQFLGRAQSAIAGMGGGMAASSALGPGAFPALVGPGGAGTSPNGFPLNAPEQSFSVNGVTAQGAAGAPAQRLQAFAQWFNDNIEPVKQLAGYDAGGHGLGNQSNHTSGTALDINWGDFTALQGHGADARTHFGPDKMAAISQALTQFGMTWGQYWTPDSRDPGHFELAGAPYSKRGPQNIGAMPGQPASGAYPIGAPFLGAGAPTLGSGGSGVVSVFVTNMPAGGFALPASPGPGTPGAPGGPGSPPISGPAAAPPVPSPGGGPQIFTAPQPPLQYHTAAPSGYGMGQGAGVASNFPGPAGGHPGFPNPGGQGFPGPGPGTPGFPNPGGTGVDESNPSPVGSKPGGPGGGWQPSGGGGLGIGGMPAAAITSAAGMFPGGGAAAQLAMKLANRTIQQVGEYAAIGVQGLQETFGVHDPDGGGNGLDDIGNNIFGRVLKGLAKAKPATGTSAGKTAGNKDKKDKQGQGQGKPGQQGGPQYNGGMHINGDLNIQQAPGQNPQTTANDVAYMGSVAASTPSMVM